MRTTLLPLAFVATIATDLASAQGTVNVPSLNDYFVMPPAGGAPSFMTPCTSPTVPLSVALTPHMFSVSAAPTASGAPVFALVNVAAPCSPGLVCLPPVAGPYAAIPPVLSCGGATNQSVDIGPGSFFLFSGTIGAAGFTSVPVTLFPPFVGISGSTQAFFFDFGTGIVATEAWNFLIVP